MGGSGNLESEGRATVNLFIVLACLNAVACAAALMRMRPATIILTANQILVLVAFGNIARFGQPTSQGFLPTSVFSLENISIAENLFCITTAMLLLIAFLPSRFRNEQLALPVVPSWVLTLLLAYFVSVAFSQRTILTNAYADPDSAVYNVSIGGGAYAFLASLLLYEVVRRTFVGTLRRSTGFAFLFFAFLATDYLKGSTGLASGFVITAATLIFSREPRPTRRWITLGAILASLALFLIAVRTMRATLSTEGTAAFAQFSSQLQRKSSDQANTGEGIETMGNGAQYAAHVLECIALYESGVDREWRSVYLPLLYTFEPSFLLRPLGIERPLEAAWELANYYIHGGGIFVVGELYWNGGYLCVVLVFAGLSWLAWKCDTRYRDNFFWLIMVCNFSSNLFQGIGYGFAQVARGAINGLLALLVWKVGGFVLRRSRGLRADSPLSDPRPSPRAQVSN